MKKIIYSLALLSFMASCQNAPEGETTNATEKKEASTATTGTTYNVDVATSNVTFIGTKPVGTHTGLMHLSNGTLTVDNGNITSGSFTIDMSKMEIKDADTNYSYKLVGHLLSPDFFDATKYPTSKFEITSCEALTNDSTGTHRISGNLTMKDSTKNVTFPANVTITETGLVATANFNIDRTQWGLHYGNDKSLKDKFIYPEVKMLLSLNATK
ncbi:MAG TPA: YceI family protein [Chitinophagaceae bacterium]|nr:YceI family protein [Chitinophagaceae bacterium]